jgi:diacylglycerol kinase (ATP)
VADHHRFAFILNPRAGRGKALKFEARLLAYLKNRRLRYSFERTTEPLHATQLAAEASKEFDVVVAMGGDGTVHEVANGVAGTNASLAILPVGSGNDFNRLVCMPKQFEHAVETVIHGTKRVFDAGHLTYTDGPDNKQHQRHFMNSLGIGLDAIVADQVRKITWLRGLPLYLAAVLNTLRNLESYNLDIQMDGWHDNKNTFVLCIGNGMFEGGGFKLTPDADPYDDKFQVCVIEEMSFKKALRVIPKLITGKHGEHPSVMLRDTRVVEVKTTTPFAMHADGEVLGRAVSSIRAEVRPRAVNVIVPG